MKRSLLLRITALALLLVLALGGLPGCVMMGERKPIATIVFSNGVEARARLYPNKAPNTVANFISLANSGYYDGTPVHRIVEYSLIQMGKNAETGAGDAGYTIKGEFPENGYVQNDMLHEPGVLSMARTIGPEGDGEEFYDTASAQFFICVDYETTLDGKYAAFGKIISGYKDVEKISKMDVDDNKAPRDEIYVVSIRVDTYGKDYGAPKTKAKDNG